MSKKRSPKERRKHARKDSTKPQCSVEAAAEPGLLERLWQLGNQFRDGRDADKALWAALRLSLDFFGAREGCVAAVRPGRDEADVLFPAPEESEWDRALLGGFLRGYDVRIPRDLMLARIRRRGRMWGALAVRSPGADYRWDARRAFSSIGAVATQLTERIDDERVREVRARIDQKIIEQIKPKDLFYKILHGIRSLLAYDHSAALLMCDDEMSTLEVVGEQIAWRKAKSQRIGLKLPLTGPLRKRLSDENVFIFNHDGRAWTTEADVETAGLAKLMDYNYDGSASRTPAAESAILCASLVTRDGPLGILKVAAVHAETFGGYEAELISQFLPQAAVALQNLRRTESLEMRMLAAERKHAMADLARGVSHDINNALGAVLPLVQQLRDDLAADCLDPGVAAEDLSQIERSVQVCRRVFGGMLNFARSASRNASDVYLHHEVDTTLAIIKDGLQRRGIRLHLDVPHDLPPIKAVQADIEQLLLNLVGNARDAMSEGGTLRIRASHADGKIDLAIADTGCGIPASHIAKIQEPFFTTKPDGNGLGLAICRSIISQMQGRLYIESTVGEGTEMTVVFPVHAESRQ